MHTGPIELRTVAQKTTQTNSGFELPIMMGSHTCTGGVEQVRLSLMPRQFSVPDRNCDQMEDGGERFKWESRKCFVVRGMKAL